MLDTETKHKIDTARNILVGRVPDPKSQIEQITIALIYKFMSDMDREAVEVFKGKAKFFTGKFIQYDWPKLFKPSLGGDDVVKLYAEAIEKMNTNPNIPPLFREIFKNAFLPFKSPETLKLFLKTINEFTYEHSERLGDAYEYLLSVLGTQGDAGQFRTPRHIIDFIVECIEPKKHDTICDPACGTAGFVISSYKYIRNTNTDKKRGDKLTPDDRKRLANSLYGYDLDPNMVRFALVNMYLHGFASPHIYEYDTLSSEERWNERYDIILANPPFMTPKGGIRPHKRFSIQAKRSEVLFTDYIHEHILPNGRGGVIVPNGIIATTQTAYKQLREMLVKESLIAVVSLPAGVFSPYSGVKTSILLLDKKLSKQTNKILFVKVENDGFDLGAQRREIDKNDLPNATALVLAFKQMLRKEITENKLTKLMEKTKLGILVEKETILANKDVVLSAERYVESDTRTTEYELVKLKDICRVINGRAYKQNELLDKGKYTVLRVGNFFTNHSWYYSDLELPEDKYCDKGDLLYAWSASFGPRIWNGNKVIYHYHIWKMIPDTSKILKEFLYSLLLKETERIKSDSGRGSTMLHITKEGIENREIPLPPLEVQQAIVAEIESYQKIIDGARQVVENYKPRLIPKNNWTKYRIADLCEKIQYGLSEKLNTENNGFKTFRMQEIKEGILCDNGKMKYSAIDKKSFKSYKLEIGDILFNRTNSIEHVGRTGIFLLEGEYAFASYLIRLKVRQDIVISKLLSLIMNTSEFQSGIKQFATRAVGQANINAQSLGNYAVYIPSLKIQKEIINQYEREIDLVRANKTLIEMFEGKIKSKIAEVWGE
jgi:type I restriction enzyme M protein